MQLFHSPASPFARKVMVLLHEAGQADAVALIPAGGNPVDPGTMPVAHNPLGKLPCLLRDDGPPMFDSRVITRYLDARLGTRLYPDPPRLWDTLTLEALADGIMDAAILMRYELTLWPEAAQRPAWVEAQWAKIVRALDAAGRDWRAHLEGPADMGQVALGCALGYLDLRHGGRDWRAGRARLAAWEAEFAARPAMAATRPQG